MALLPINQAIGLVSAFSQNQEARRRQQQADRLAEERLNESKRYHDSQTQRYNDLVAQGHYDPTQRSNQLKAMYKLALDQGIGQINAQALATGRAGDSLPVSASRFMAEQNALDLAGRELDMRDRLAMQQTEDFSRLTNPAGYMDALGSQTGYMSERAKGSAVNPAGLLMSAFNTAQGGNSFLDDEIRNREYRTEQRANSMSNPFFSGGSNDRAKEVRGFLTSGKFWL